jgi:hypothetical protein
VPKILSKINLPQYAAAPGSPAQGDMYYNTVDDTVYVYDGTSWLDLAAGGGGTGDITAVVAGDGLTGGATVGSATLDVGAGTGISVSSDAVAIDTSVVPVKTDNLSVFATSTSAAIGIGSVELGHATDTTITRSGAGTIAVEGVDLVNTNDARLTDSRTPTAHAASHKSAGSDAIKLNELAAPDADVSLNSNKITNLATPTSNADAATKAYVDAVAEGLDVKASCRLATTVADGNIGLSGLSNIDGVTPLAGDRILVKNQTTESQNGIYVADSSSWSRASDAAQSGEITPGTFVFVEEGSQADSGWVVTTNGTITIGATDIVWTQFSGAGQIVAGTGITKSGNTISVDTTTVPLKTDNLSVFAGTTSAQLAGVISDETGSGALVFGTDATLSLPVINNPKFGYATTVTSASTLTLTNTSAYYQVFTGSNSSQVVQLPVASTMAIGQGFIIANNSTVDFNIQSSGGNQLRLLRSKVAYLITCVLNSGTGANSWSWKIVGSFTEQTGTGSLVFAVQPEIQFANLTKRAILGQSVVITPRLITSSGGSSTLSNTDDGYIRVTGASAHTLVLPGAGTVGQRYWVRNDSTGQVTVNSSGGNLVATIPSEKAAEIICLTSSGTTASDWGVHFLGGSTAAGDGNAVYYQSTQPTGGTYAAGDIWVDSDDNTTPNTNNLIFAQKTANYTLASDLSDAPDEVIEMNVSSANTVTIPTNATAAYPIGTQIHILQTGTGQTSVAGASGVTVNSATGLKLKGQWSMATIIKRASDTWLIVGDLTA